MWQEMMGNPLGSNGPNRGKQNHALSSVSPHASEVGQAHLEKAHSMQEGAHKIHPYLSIYLSIYLNNLPLDYNLNLN